MAKIAVIGGGISGLAHATFLAKQSPQNEIDIFEFDHWGGVIRSRKHDEAVFEAGPEGYLVRNPLLPSLVKELGIEKDFVPAEKAAAKRYIVKEGRLVKLPSGPVSFLFNSVLFFPEKIKTMLAFRKKFNLWEKMSVFDAVKAMTTMTTAEYFASAFCRGVYGSEAEDIEFAAILPDLFEAIQNEPSLKAAIKKLALEKKTYWKQQLGEDSYSGWERGLYSFRGGLETFIDALKQNLKERPNCSFRQAKVSNLVRSGNKTFLHSRGDKFGPYEQVYLAVPAYAAAEILKVEMKPVAHHLNKMQYSPISVVVCGWSKKTFSAGGFGFIAPRKEQLPILGTQFTSNIFADRAPKNMFLTKTMIAGDTELFSDDELAERVLNGHKRLFRLSAGPEWYEVFRYKPGLPRYFIGYTEWKRELREKMKDAPGIHLCGWSFDGIGLPHALEAAYKRIHSEKKDSQ